MPNRPAKPEMYKSDHPLDQKNSAINIGPKKIVKTILMLYKFFNEFEAFTVDLIQSLMSSLVKGSGGVRFFVHRILVPGKLTLRSAFESCYG